ncbi:hypothetical protein Dsin_022755 [Dipteronia sinensis]|uniref:non-specific serine/threonine protein kinase n=1 Tax=Dipteronia sinensis TaxID=43782 RepID=A0AAE0A2J6_9ROSI|nr:hypothetical protein Dsin_022755 [Dipteronia sinensis]
MKFGINLTTGLEWFLTSWKSTDDPSQGEFTEMIDPRGTPQLFLKKGPVILYRTGSWNGVHFTGSPLLKPNSIYAYNFVSNEKEVFYTYEIQDSSVLSRVVLTPSGVVQRFTWMDETHTWVGYYAKMRDECSNYSLCGAYASCNINNFPVCTCFKGFVPKSQQQWNIYNWSAGCIRKTPLDCQHGDGFMKHEAIKLPDTSHSRTEKYISLVECKKLCLSNCSCTAYATLDIREGGSGCLLWFNDLIDISDIDGGQDLYVRVAALELDNIESRRQPSGKKHVYVIIIVASIISGMGALVLAWIMYMCKTKLKNEGHTDDNHKMDDNDEGSEKDDTGLIIYDLKTIAIATDNFSDKNKLGEGGFGPVYKGTLIEGQEIAVKRLSRCSGQGMKEFKNEVILIAKLQHRNLVKLLGCCTERNERMLIYEYMPNKSLDYFIFDKTRRQLLDWSKCIQIIVGTARGILYLHQDSRLRIIHRDLKASNVLLDNDMNPKISDFGMARTFGGDQTEAETNKIVGTYGYMSPEYAVDGIFSMKSDVFSFGVLVLEIVSGKRNRGFCHIDHNHNLLGHAWRLWNEERTVELIDKSLDYSSASSEMLRCIHVGLLCVQQRPEDRPNMSTVVLMLGGERSLPQPKQPGFFTERNLPESELSLSKELLSSTNEFTISLIFGGDQTEAGTNRVVGTYGYMSPEYTVDEIFSMESDVYNFGVLVLEIVSGKKNRGFYHTDHKHNLLGHAWRLWNEEKALELIDKSLDYSSDSSEMLRCIHVGLLYVQQEPEDRPNMSTVALMLGGEGSLLQPKQPGFFKERNIPESESSVVSNDQSSSTNEITVSMLEAR